MTSTPRLTLSSTTLDAPDAAELARFYQALLGWRVTKNEQDWVEIAPPGGTTGLAFQTESAYRRPRWPGTPADQQMMMHLDIEVDDLPAAVAHAVALGATVADFQPQEDVRVLLDPAGHPFCLYIGTEHAE
ncbi:VOC family protein [Streptomyces sp. NPDC085946]|uniref:VOC family protein n=1 Tax=Streptomyces sp. NPDC085946 TaxID=3365744 RepID=UPI0037D95B03